MKSYCVHAMIFHPSQCEEEAQCSTLYNGEAFDFLPRIAKMAIPTAGLKAIGVALQLGGPGHT